MDFLKIELIYPPTDSSLTNIGVNSVVKTISFSG